MLFVARLKPRWFCAAPEGARISICTLPRTYVLGYNCFALRAAPTAAQAQWAAARAAHRKFTAMSLGRRLRRGGLRLLAQRRKSGGVVDRQIGQDLAIQINAGFLQTIDELAVAGAVQLGRGADAHDPNGAVLPLLLLASAVGELQPTFDRLFGRTEKFGFC